MSTKDRFTALSMDREHTVRFADHEVFLSFNNDEDAIAFRDWWHRSGSASFKKWNDRRKEFYDKESKLVKCANCRRTSDTRICEKCKWEVA